MAEYVSEIKVINYPVDSVYNKLSDLSNLDQLIHQLPKDKINFNIEEIDSDHIAIDVPSAGTISFKIVDREINKTIKFETDKSPVAANLWIQLQTKAQEDRTTYLRLTLKADLNFFIKKMVDGKLKTGINKLAEVFSVIPYE